MWNSKVLERLFASSELKFGLFYVQEEVNAGL